MSPSRRTGNERVGWEIAQRGAVRGVTQRGTKSEGAGWIGAQRRWATAGDLRVSDGVRERARRNARCGAAGSARCEATHRGGEPPRAMARRRDGDIAPYRNGTRVWGAATERGEGAWRQSAARGRDLDDGAMRFSGRAAVLYGRVRWRRVSRERYGNGFHIVPKGENRKASRSD